MNNSSSNMAYLMAHALQPGYEEDLFAGEAALAAAVGLNSADESVPYSTAELNAPEYSTDDFRMFSFKVARCSKRYVHDWRACPFAHPTENARRRDPRLHKYLPVPCPEYKRGICFRGDACPYSHGVYECWLHPAKYRTQLCKEGPHCRRPVCFFAHSVLDLRQPTHVWDGNNYAEPQTAAAALVQAAAAPAGRTGSDSALLLQQQQQLAQQHSSSVEEALNNSASGGMVGAGSEVSLPSVAAGKSTGGSSSSSGGPSSPHGSGGEPRSCSPGQALPSPAQAAGVTWSTPTAARLLAERSGSGEATPTTPSRATSSDVPARPSAEASAAAVLAASPADLSALANLVALAQPPAPAPAAVQASPTAHAAAGLPRHSIDVGALAASRSRGGLSAAAATAAPGRNPFELAAAGGSAVPSPQSQRMSLDSLMQTRASGSQAWPPAPNGYGSIQEMQAGGAAPRMSNAVARKLGLAPQRTANEARLAKLRNNSAAGLATPPRTSLDGLLQALHSGRPSLEQQMVNQQMLAAAGLAQMNYVAPYPGPGAYAGAPVAGDPSLGINPALLSVVAAQMGGAVPPPQAQNAAAMAALMESLNGWNLNGGMQQGGYPGAPQPLPHRASYDSGMPPHAATYMGPHQGPHTSSPYFLPSELESMMNNGELVHPVAAGQGRNRE